MAILKTIVFQLFQCDCIDLWNTTGHTGDPDVVMNRIVCDPADMGFISKNNFFYKFMGLFINDVDDRVMRIGMTVSSDQKVIFGNGKSLRSHGSTDGRSIFFSENLCFCSIKSRNNAARLTSGVRESRSRRLLKL